MCTHGTLLVCSCGCMANRVKWIRCKLQVIVDFSARFGETNWRFDIVKTFNDQLHLKTLYAVCFWKKTHSIWKNTIKSTPWLQEQQTAADTHHMSSQSTLFQPGLTPPAEPTWCQPGQLPLLPKWLPGCRNILAHWGNHFMCLVSYGKWYRKTLRWRAPRCFSRSPLKGDIPNKYPLYKVYIGLIIKGTIQWVPPFSQWCQQETTCQQDDDLTELEVVTPILVV